MTDHLVDFTDEERELTKGMPINIAVGFVAARRGTDVRGVHSKYASVAEQLNDLISKKNNGVDESDVRAAFEKFSSEWKPRGSS